MKTTHGFMALIKRMFCGKNYEEELRELIKQMMCSVTILRRLNIESGDTLILSCPKKLREDSRKHIIDLIGKLIQNKNNDINIVIFDEGLKISGVIKDGSDLHRPDIAD